MTCARRHGRRCASCNADRARQREHLKAKYAARHEALVQLLGGRCVECGATEGLELDHVEQGEKAFNITKHMTASWDRLLEEAKKCQLLCGACHRRTFSYGRSREIEVAPGVRF